MTEQEVKDKAQQITDRTNAIKMYGKNADDNYRAAVRDFEAFLKEYSKDKGISYDNTYYPLVNDAYGKIGKNNNKDTDSIITSQLYWFINPPA